MIRATTFVGKTVAVFGLGGSGLATCQSLIAGGATVAAWDDGAAARATAAEAGIPLVDLEAADWWGFSSLVLAPGVPLTHPQPHWTVKRAQAAGIEVIGDIEIFSRERQVVAPDAPFIAITGTNGKSTTTALIGHVLSGAAKTGFGQATVQVGGNIGVPILSLAAFDGGHVYVVEVSSYQIDLTPSLHPSIGVMLNVTPDHIDRHGTFENYAAVKERVMAQADIAVASIDDPVVNGMIQRAQAKRRRVVRLTTTAPFAADLNASDTDLLDAGGRKVASLDGIATLRGRHNAQNALAAIAVAQRLGCDADQLQRSLQEFPGLAHRMQFIAQRGRTQFYNDSKATNADSTDKALAAFDRDIYWIAGGLAKDGGIAPLKPHFARIAKAYLIGESAQAFAETLGRDVPFEICETVERAVIAAARDAQADGADAPVVLLSPACASFDQYRNFELRGDAFCAAVGALEGVQMVVGGQA